MSSSILKNIQNLQNNDQTQGLQSTPQAEKDIQEQQHKNSNKKYYRILLTNLFHDRKEHISYNDISLAFKNIDKKKLFPFLYYRMDAYFEDCKNGQMADIMRAFQSSYDHRVRVKLFGKFINFFYDTIGQSVKCVRNYYSKIDPENDYDAELAADLCDKFESKFFTLISNYLEEIDQKVCTSSDSFNFSVLFDNGNNFETILDAKTKKRIKNMNAKALFIEQYQILNLVLAEMNDKIDCVNETVVEQINFLLDQKIKELSETSETTNENHDDLASNPKFIHYYKSSMQKFLEITVLRRRIENFFAFVQSFPNCCDAINELGYLTDKYNYWSILSLAVTEIITARVCAPHAATYDLIVCYMNTVQVLIRLENGPSYFQQSSENANAIDHEMIMKNRSIRDFQLLDCLKPLENYLKSRSDTVSEIVKAMLSDDLQNNILAQNMQDSASKKIMTDDDYFNMHMNWQPSKPTPNYYNNLIAKTPDFWSGRKSHLAPDDFFVNGNPTQNFGSAVGRGQPHDLLSLMLSVYGSAEKFIKSYQKLLVNRLVSNFNSGISEIVENHRFPSRTNKMTILNNPTFITEKKNLNLLRNRFENGHKSSLLDNCQVMFKDFEESVRLQTIFNNNNSKESNKSEPSSGGKKGLGGKFRSKMLRSRSKGNKNSKEDITVENNYEESDTVICRDSAITPTITPTFYTLLISDQCWGLGKDLLNQKNESNIDSQDLQEFDFRKNFKANYEEFTLPLQITNWMESYDKMYQNNKGSRFVEYYKTRGFCKVEIDMEMSDEPPFVIECDPISITVLDFISNHESSCSSTNQRKPSTRKSMQNNSNTENKYINYSEFSKLNLPKKYLEQSLNFWKANFIIKEDANHKYKLANDEASRIQRQKLKFSKENQQQNSNNETGSTNLNQIEILNDDSSTKKSKNGCDAEDNAVLDNNEEWMKSYNQYWNYMKMQMRVAPKQRLSLEILHTKLSVFANLGQDSDGDEQLDSDLSVLGDKRKLKLFMGKKLKAGEIFVIDGDMYTLKK